MNFLSTTSLALAALSTGTQALAQETRYRDPVFSSVQTQQDVRYGQAVNNRTGQLETLLLDVYTPRGDQAPARPAIVVVHGGGFVGGDKGTSNIVQLATEYAKRGYVAVSINYRLRPRGGVTTAQDIRDAGHDMKAAVRWLRRHATQLRIDVDRIAGTGSSAGGYTCCEAAYVESEGVSGNPGFSSELCAIVELWGALADVNEMDTGEAPVQIIHGTNDPVVAYQLGLDLHARAQAVGVPSELVPIQDAGHGPWAAYFAIYQERAAAFLYEHLRLSELSGLVARPGAASPGTVTIDTFGVAGDIWILAYSDQLGSVPIPNVGTLCLEPLGLVTAVISTLPTTPRLASASWSTTVPAGLQGYVLHWQAIHGDPVTLRLLTNCVETVF